MDAISLPADLVPRTKSSSRHVDNLPESQTDEDLIGADPEKRLARWCHADSSSLTRFLSANSASFRFAARFLPRQFHGPVADMYAYCRLSDDIADDTSHSLARRTQVLGYWQEQTTSAIMTGRSDYPLLSRIASTIQERSIRKEYPILLLDGMRMDMDHAPFASMADLERYMYLVASVVGQWMTELSGIREPWVLEKAAHMGYAMQLTNILRDVGEDLNNGRMYIPLDSLSAHDLEIADLGPGLTTSDKADRYRELMQTLIRKAEAWYRSAGDGIPHLPRYFQPAVLISGMVYRDILRVLKGNGYDNFNRRAITSKSQKVQVAGKALVLWMAMGSRTPFNPVQ